jgi:Ca2+/Na+ antiporter
MTNYLIIIISTLIPLLIYAFLIYLSENLILKYIGKYSKYYSSWPEHYLLIYTAGIASALQSFLPGLIVALNGDPKLGYYFQLYNVVLDYTITLGTFILAFNFERGMIDSNVLSLIMISIIAQVFVLMFKQINFISGSILYLIFIIISIFLFYKYRRKSEKIAYIPKSSFYEYFKAIVFSLEIALAISIIYIGGNILNNISNTLQGLNLSIPLIGYAISLILFTLPDILYGHFSWFKNKDLNISMASISGEEISAFTIFTGILGMISPIKFSSQDFIPIISSFLVLLISIIILYISSYKKRIPRWVGILLISLGIIIGFIDGIANLS